MNIIISYVPFGIVLNFYANKLQFILTIGENYYSCRKRLLNMRKIFLLHLREGIINKLAGTITLNRDITLDYYKFSEYNTCRSNRVWLFTHIYTWCLMRPQLKTSNYIYLRFYSISIIEIFWLLLQRN